MRGLWFMDSAIVQTVIAILHWLITRVNFSLQSFLQYIYRIVWRNEVNWVL